MRKVALFTLLLMLITTPALASEFAQQNVTPEPLSSQRETVDREMSTMLNLRGEQIEAYQNLMRVQREAYLLTAPDDISQRLTIYEETIELLRPILDIKQLAQFAAYTRSVIIECENHSQLTMND